MLIRLAIENFRSIRDAVELSMRASGEVPRTEAGEPFRLDAEHRTRPSRVELHVLVDGRVYRYGFSATEQAIEQESLSTIVDGQEHPLFSRSHDRLELSDALTREVEDPKRLEQIARGTPRGRLFLHEATHRNVDSRTLATIFSWFQQQLTIIPPTPDPQRLITRIDTDASFRGFLERVMRWADTGIRELFSCMAQAASCPVAFATTPDEGEQLSLRFRHGDDGTTPTFELDDESDGTRRLLHLASALYQGAAFRLHLVHREDPGRCHPAVLAGQARSRPRAPPRRRSMSHE